MSNRNNQANKQAARERLRAERERQKKKDRLRRQFAVGGGVVVVLAIAAGIAVAVANSGGGSSKPQAADVNSATNSGVSTNAAWTSAKKDKLVEPAHTTGPDGTTIVIGKAGAKKTLNLYEDPRCPSCAAFEQAVGSTVVKDIDSGKYRGEYHLGAFLDANLKGTGSKNAVSALGAALNVSPDAFLHYKEALFSTKYHPEETGPDKFADDSYLIKVADTVPQLKGDKSFQTALKKGTYDRWALQMSAAFNASGIDSTPTVKMGDTKIQVQGQTPAAMVSSFNSQVKAALKK